jgi:hypothetical protein
VHAMNGTRTRGLARLESSRYLGLPENGNTP